MNAGHVALQTAVGDKGLGTAVDQAPEEQKNKKSPTRAGGTLNARLPIMYLCGFSPLWLSSCLVSW